MLRLGARPLVSSFLLSSSPSPSLLLRLGSSGAGSHQTPIVKKLWTERTSKHLDFTGPRTSSFSQQEILYDFENDYELRDKYANPWGFIRIGRVLEDIDALAGNIAHIHCCEKDGETDLLLVTASVDQIKIRHRANLKDNMTLQGKVIHSGSSSLEIRMAVTSDWTTENWLSANFTFVARHPTTGKAAPVPPLILENDEQISVFNHCEDLRQRAKEIRKQKKGILDLFGLTVPSELAAEKAAQLLQESTPLTLMPAAHFPHSVLIQNTKISHNLICHHQHRNVHGRIFGGFLIRQAFELAFVNAYQFLESQPLFVEVDRVVFQRPVEIGDLLKFESCILYTTPTKDGKKAKVHVEVSADIVTPEQHKAERSNLFHFTFVSKTSKEVKKVLPGTVEEALRIATMMELNEKQEKNSSK